MSDVEYVLPKSYNGKTVTELFPEFKHNSVCIIFLNSPPPTF
jgi:hypothetical protein